MSDDLFTGTDDAAKSDGPTTDGGEIVDNDQPPLTGGMPIDVEAWLKDFTYREAHSATVGFAPMYVGLVLLLLVPTAGTALVVASAALTTAVLLRPSAVHSQLRYVVKEPHYYVGSTALAALAGIVTIGAVVILATILSAIPLYRLSWFQGASIVGLAVVAYAVRTAIRVVRN